MKTAHVMLMPFLVALCAAEDFTLADGTLLQEARVVRHDGESAIIAHATGVQRVTYDRLPAELQERLDLTPEAVAARREQARQAARARAEARDQRAARQRAALETSGLSPRYMSGADVVALFQMRETISPTEAEYLAAGWNRREALRCGLTVEAQMYKEDAAALEPRVERERSATPRLQERVASLEKELKQAQEELKRAQAAVHKLDAENASLQKELSQRSNTTVVVREPTYVPVYRPAPIVVPPVRVPGPPAPVVRPNPAPRVLPARPAVNPARPSVPSPRPR